MVRASDVSRICGIGGADLLEVAQSLAERAPSTHHAVLPLLFPLPHEAQKPQGSQGVESSEKVSVMLPIQLCSQPGFCSLSILRMSYKH